ncbi:MAG: hypothetical protein ACRCX8_12850 [Sarcina sp.]
MKENSETKEDKVIKYIYVPFFTSMWHKGDMNIFNMNDVRVSIFKDKEIIERYRELDLMNINVEDLRTICPSIARDIIMAEYDRWRVVSANSIEEQRKLINITPKNILDSIVNDKVDRTNIDKAINTLKESFDIEKGFVTSTSFKIDDTHKDLVTKKAIEETFSFSKLSDIELFEKMFYILNGFRIK